MLLWFLQHVAAASSLASLGKITARASLAALVSFLLAVILGPRSIAWLARRFREPIKSDSPEICRLHQAKKATPTMGGLFIVAGLVGSLLLAGDLTNRYLLLALGVAGGLTLLGAIDDLVKLRTEKRGISAASKLAGQVLVAAAAALCLYFDHASLPDGLVLPPPLNRAPASLGNLVRAAGHRGDRRLVERRESDRRARRTGRRMPAVRRRGHDPGGLCGGAFAMGRLSQHSAYCRLRRIGRPGRRR